MTCDQYESWYQRVSDWAHKSHKAILEAEYPVCEACEFRNGAGCISKACPVFAVLDQANKTEKMLRKVTRNWPALSHTEIKD